MNRTAQVFIASPVCEAPVQVECSVARWIWKLFAPTLVMFGIVGNIFVVIVMSRKKLRALSTVMYCMCLAVSDITFSVTTLARNLLMASTSKDLYNMSMFNCLLLRWVVFTSAGTSAWLICLLTIERTYVTVWSNAPVMTSRKRALIACVILIITMALFNGYVLFAFNLENVTETLTDVNGTATTVTSFVCLPRTVELNDFIEGIWKTIIFIAFNVIPLLIVLSGNAVILTKLIHQHRKIRMQVNPGIAQSSGFGKKFNSATRMVLVVSCFFFVTTIPFTLSSVIINKSYNGVTERTTVARIQLVSAMLYLLLYCNYTCNFWLYIASGSLFKNECTCILRAISDTYQRHRRRVIHAQRVDVHPLTQSATRIKDKEDE